LATVLHAFTRRPWARAAEAFEMFTRPAESPGAPKVTLVFDEGVGTP
jgi:hypothetical protein